MVNCRLFWQFSGLVGGGGLWVGHPRSLDAWKLCAGLSFVFRRVGAYLNGCQGMADAFLRCTGSFPSPNRARILRAACTLDEPSYSFIIILFFFSVCLFWRGMNSPYCTVLAGTTSRDQQIFISVIQERMFTWLVQWSLFVMFTATRDPDSDKWEQR
jgi:hypothetical protein